MEKAKAILLDSKGRVEDEKLEIEMENSSFQKFNILKKERNGGVINGAMGLGKNQFCLPLSWRDAMHIFRHFILRPFMSSWELSSLYRFTFYLSSVFYHLLV